MRESSSSGSDADRVPGFHELKSAAGNFITNPRARIA
jgi:hypothetical protein